MNYFQISVTWDPKIKGVKDGSNQVELITKYVNNKKQLELIQKHFSWIDYWKKRNYKPDFEFPLEGYKLRKTANLTDIIDYSPSYAGCPFMINSKTANLLKFFSLPEHYILPVEIKIGDLVNNDYSLLNLLYSPIDILDFANCIFASGYDVSNNLKYENFENYTAFQNSGVSNKRIHKLAFQKELNLDLFYTRVGGIIVSEKLKIDMENKQLTGVEFKPTSNL